MDKTILKRLGIAEQRIADLYKKLKALTSTTVIPYSPSYWVVWGNVSGTAGGVASITIQENTTGQVVTFTRDGVGRYNLNIGGNILTAANCWYNITQDNNNQNMFWINYDPSFGNTSNIKIDSGRTDGGGFFDGSLINTPFEIRIKKP